MTANREIKFRVWGSEEKNMYYPQDVVQGQAGDFSIGFVRSLGFIEATLIREDNTYFIWRGARVMQYTGFKDKNGKEIYEKDLVYAEFKIKSQSEKYKRLLAIVEWSELHHGWHLSPYYKGENWYPCAINRTNMELAGNIYENPELLKEKNDSK